MRKMVWAAVTVGAILTVSPLWAVGGNMGIGTEPLTNGSAAYPWLIEDLADFDAFAGNSAYWASGVYTKLMTDIDLSGRTYTTAVIAPDTSTNSGFQGAKFSGLFDGNNHVVSNLTISAPTKDYIGLFGCIGSGGEILNLGLKDTDITGWDYVGGLVGSHQKGTIRNCYTTGSINGSWSVGGLAGGSQGLINNCYSKGTVNGATAVGGLIGFNTGYDVSRCYAAGSVSGRSHIGGLVGWNYYCFIKQCCATGPVDGTSGIGGLVGWHLGSLISDCYTTGPVSGYTDVGGLVGSNEGSIINCYAVGTITGTNNVGGLLGYFSYPISFPPTFFGLFWDEETTGIDESGEGTPKTTAQMQTSSTFVEAGWDFSATDGDAADWMMLRQGEDYPRLAWQAVYAGDVAGLYGVDVDDLMEVAENWLETGCPGNCEQADIDSSGDVGLGDLAVLAADWMEK